MEDYKYWQKQTRAQALDGIDIERPEQRRMAGKVLIIGGNKGMFFAVANAVTTANKMGAGEVRAILPDTLRGQVPSVPEIYFVPAEASGAFGKTALSEIYVQIAWADAVVLIGDLGKNAETSIAFAEFMKTCTDKPIYLTRDAVDAVINEAQNWSLRDDICAFATMPQLQKMLRTMYYPKVVTLSMPMNQLIETLHKFTISFPLAMATLHNGQLIFAQDGEVSSIALSETKWSPISIWNGDIVTQAAILRLWNPQKTLKVAITAAAFVE